MTLKNTFLVQSPSKDPLWLDRQIQKCCRRPPVMNTIKQILNEALLTNFSSDRTPGITGGRPTGAPGGRPTAPKGRPPDADSSAVGHPEGAQREAAESQILLLLGTQRGWNSESAGRPRPTEAKMRSPTPCQEHCKRIPKEALLSNFSSNRTQGITGGVV